MGAIFEAHTRDDGFKVVHETAGDDGPDPRVTRYFIGERDGAVYMTVRDNNGAEGYAKFDLRGNLLKVVTFAATDILHGVIDNEGNIWLGDIAGQDLLKVDPVTDQIVGTIHLDDGVFDSRPLGMAMDRATGLMYVATQTVGVESLRLYIVNPRTLSITVTGAELATLGSIVDSLGLIRTPIDNANGTQWWIASRNSATNIVKWNSGINVVTSVPVNNARNHGLFGIHYAFGRILVGGRALADPNDLQISVLDLLGNVVNETVIADADIISGFANDATHLYAVVNGREFSSPTTNRILKINPDTLAIDDTFLFDGTNENENDGLGETPLDVITVSDPPSFPNPVFNDALLWFRADDPDRINVGSEIHEVPNRGPRGGKARTIDGKLSEITISMLAFSNATRPARSTLNGLEVAFFGGDDMRHDGFLNEVFIPLHDGTGMTAIMVFHSVGVGTQTLLLTAPIPRTNFTGIVVLYDGTDESVTVTISNGLNIGFVIDETTATGSLPNNQTHILTISYDESRAAGEEFQIRLVTFASGVLSEPKTLVSTASSGEPPVSTNPLVVLQIGNSARDQLEAFVGEYVIIEGSLLEFQQREVEEYLSRWLV